MSALCLLVARNRALLPASRRQPCTLHRDHGGLHKHVRGGRVLLVWTRTISDATPNQDTQL